MRRTAAGIAATLVAALVVTGPMATPGHAAAAAAIHCGGSISTPDCALLDDLAEQLAPLAPVLGLAGPEMAQRASTVQGLASRAAQPAGVPEAEAAMVSQALADQIAALSAPVRSLVDATALGELTETLSALVDQLAAPPSGNEGAAQSDAPASAGLVDPAPTSAASASGPHRTTFGGSLSTSDAPAIPEVPVGDSLVLEPLGAPEFRHDRILDPVAVDAPAQPVELDVDAARAEAAAALRKGGRGPELVVVMVVSLLLIAGAFVANAQQNRHTIP